MRKNFLKKRTNATIIVNDLNTEFSDHSLSEFPTELKSESSLSPSPAKPTKTVEMEEKNSAQF